MRKVIITQEQAEYIQKKLIGEEIGLPTPQKAGKPYFISPEKVLIVKRFLDSNFKKGSYENIGANGFPQKQRIVAMLSSDGQVLKNMYLDQLKDLLIDKFQNMFVDDEERSIFMERVLNDWFDDKIGVFGTLSVNHLNENEDLINDFEDIIDDAVPNVLDDFDSDKAKGISRMSWNVIDPVQYKKALELFMEQGPALFRFPDSIIDGWLKGAISNIYRLEATTALYGHTNWFPAYDIADHYDIDISEIDDQYGYLVEYLDKIGFYDWAVLPDGTWACSDYGFQQYDPILREYSSNLTAGQKLILLNRIIDIHHCRGNLSSAFIKGGAAACSAISNLNENIDKPINIYHCLSPKSMNLIDACRNVAKNGLIPNNNGEVGNAIWFSYTPYYENAKVVLGLEMTNSIKNEYDITGDRIEDSGENGILWAHTSIPFESLFIKKAPAIYIHRNKELSFAIDFDKQLSNIQLKAINKGLKGMTDVYGECTIFTDILYPFLTNPQIGKIEDNPMIKKDILFKAGLNENKIIEKLALVRKDVNTSPTEAQKKAGNYAMGHIVIDGMEITIENPKGSYRKGKDRNGKEWKCLMHNDYGYFTKSKGYDGDAVDVFIGPDIDDYDKVYVVDQNNSKREFDESKVMLGFKSKKEAKAAYLSNYSKDWKGFRKITGVSLKLFKKWLYRGRKQQQPFADYVEIKKNQLNESKQLTPMDDYRDFAATDMGRKLEPGRFSNTPKSTEPGFDGWKRVRKGTKMNLQNEGTGELISSQWFDWVGYMIDGIAIVSDNGKWNYINQSGNLISSIWFDDVSEFNDGFGEVTIKNNNGDELIKRIDRNGNLFVMN